MYFFQSIPQQKTQIFLKYFKYFWNTLFKYSSQPHSSKFGVWVTLTTFCYINSDQISEKIDQVLFFLVFTYRFIIDIGVYFVAYGILVHPFSETFAITVSFLFALTCMLGYTSPASITNQFICAQSLKTIKLHLDKWSFLLSKVQCSPYSSTSTSLVFGSVGCRSCCLPQPLSYPLE